MEAILPEQVFVGTKVMGERRILRYGRGHRRRDWRKDAQPFGLAETNRLIDHLTPVEPTELIPFNNEAL